MEAQTPAKVIRKVRKRIEVSQEGLARLLNATKGAVQHWERGRNNPDLARLNALRQLCPAGPERKELDGLIKQTQARLAPCQTLRPEKRASRAIPGRPAPSASPAGALSTFAARTTSCSARWPSWKPRCSDAPSNSASLRISPPNFSARCQSFGPATRKLSPPTHPPNSLTHPESGRRNCSKFRPRRAKGGAWTLSSLPCAR